MAKTEIRHISAAEVAAQKAASQQPGYAGRVKSSFKNIGTGAVLFLGTTALLWWNEGRAVHTAQDIAEVGGKAQHVADINNVDTSLEGQVVHMNGQASTTDVLTAPEYGISVNALKLTGRVEYYQWKENSRTETRENADGSKDEITTYTYEQVWTSDPIASGAFHDEAYVGKNTQLVTLTDVNARASQISFGAYKLPAFMEASLISGAPTQKVALNPSPEVLEALNAKVRTNSYYGGNYVHVVDNVIYFGSSASSPNIGDARITFTYAVPQADISLIAVVKGNTFEKYNTKNDSDESYFCMGNRSLEEFIQRAEDSNSNMTWILRVLGLVLVCMALRMMFGLLASLLSFVPFLSSILNWATKIICNTLGFVWTLIIVSIAWVFYRPMLGIALLVIAGALVYFLAIKGKDKQAPEAEAPAAPAE